MSVQDIEDKISDSLDLTPKGLTLLLVGVPILATLLLMSIVPEIPKIIGYHCNIAGDEFFVLRQTDRDAWLLPVGESASHGTVSVRLNAAVHYCHKPINHKPISY